MRCPSHGIRIHDVVAVDAVEAAYRMSTRR
jgi:hypothetical protein